MLAPCPDSKDYTTSILAGARCQPKTIWEEFPTVGRKWHLQYKFKLLSAASDAKQAPFETALWESTPGHLKHDISNQNCFLCKPNLGKQGNHSLSNKLPDCCLIADSCGSLIISASLKKFFFDICLLLICPQNSWGYTSEVKHLHFKGKALASWSGTTNKSIEFS